ncbi:NAD-dependent protein deacylase-like isoform X2 [Planococcus citri]
MSANIFKGYLKTHSNILVLTGAGISAESGIPTFRGVDGMWRKYPITEVANPAAFRKRPSLVWEFYSYRRGVALNAKPNKAHYMLAEVQKRCAEEGRNLNVVTQNVDGLHIQAGAKNVIEMHGSLFRTKCTKCNRVEENREHPICEALRGRGAPDVENHQDIPLDQLPRCKHSGCGGLLRPDIVWFGEYLDPNITSKIAELVDTADVYIVIGSSSEVYPARQYLNMLKARDVITAEFNVALTSQSNDYSFIFQGPCTETIPKTLNYWENNTSQNEPENAS